MDVGLVWAAAAAAAPPAGVDWVRTVGILGIIGVWAWRGFHAVFSRRRARLEALAEDREATQDPPPLER
jgi:hypothetical protein